MQTKAELRKLLRQRRAELSAEYRLDAALKVLQYLCETAEWRGANIIHCYRSFGTELSTDDIVKSSWNQGKRVIVPITEINSMLVPETTLLHAEIHPQTRFTADSFGIPTPTPDSSLLCEPTQIMHRTDLVLMPLLGFDAKFHRLGHGRGYYDRFLATLSSQKLTKPCFAGLAFDVQFVQEPLPHEAHDVGLDMVITESGVVTALRAGQSIWQS